MELKDATAVLYVKDAKKSCDFYVNVLGMTVIADFGGLNYSFKEGFAIWQIMEDNLIPRLLGNENITNAEAAPRFQIGFETDDIDSVYATLKENNVKFLHEINLEIWGQRNIRFYDPDGHLIEVGESFPIFLGRICEEEKGNVEAIAKRTFMDPEAVKQFMAGA